MKIISFLFVMLFGIATHASADETRLTPKDFYSGIVLSADVHAVQTVLIPLELYRNVQSDDLSDVRAFNKANQEVPHTIRILYDSRTVFSHEESVLYFPLYRQGKNAPSHDDISLRVVRSADGKVIDIRSASGRNDADIKTSPIDACILDVSNIERPITSLRLSFADVENGFVFSPGVYLSDDLSDWRSAQASGVIAQLQYDAPSAPASL